MADQHTTYNGWTNRATWLLSLWLDNDEPAYRHWRQRAADICDRAMRAAPRRPVEARRRATTALIATLKVAVTGRAAVVPSGFYSDRNTGSGAINYREIVGHWVDEHIGDK